MPEELSKKILKQFQTHKAEEIWMAPGHVVFFHPTEKQADEFEKSLDAFSRHNGTKEALIAYSQGKQVVVRVENKTLARLIWDEAVRQGPNNFYNQIIRKNPLGLDLADTLGDILFFNPLLQGGFIAPPETAINVHQEAHDYNEGIARHLKKTREVLATGTLSPEAQTLKTRAGEDVDAASFMQIAAQRRLPKPAPGVVAELAIHAMLQKRVPLPNPGNPHDVSLGTARMRGERNEKYFSAVQERKGIINEAIGILRAQNKWHDEKIKGFKVKTDENQP